MPCSCPNVSYPLTSRESSNEPELADFPTLSKKPRCWGGCCCPALSLALMYALRAAQRGWDKRVSSHLGFVAALVLLERHQEGKTGPRNWLVTVFPSLLCCLTPCPPRKNKHAQPDFQVLLLVKCPSQQRQPGEGWGCLQAGKERGGSRQATELCSHHVAWGLG